MSRVVAALLVLTAAVAARAQCPGDNDRNGMVTIAEAIAAISSALHGCSEPSLAPLLGTWNFREEGSSGTGRIFRFERIEGGRITGNELGSFPSQRGPFEVTVVDGAFPLQLIKPQAGFCSRYRLRQDSPDRMVGSFVFLTEENGTCGAVFSSAPEAIEAIRIE